LLLEFAPISVLRYSALFFRTSYENLTLRGTQEILMKGPAKLVGDEVAKLF